ncbi:MAG: transporter substrate-binding domain-containing protein [Deltaproteobacteria bacterium]|jgi:L-cystine transport system substrate-binding protein|nr:transporter substrate-binding domain-containing protein [Deltaproteobacteria bacterium]
MKQRQKTTRLASLLAALALFILAPLALVACGSDEPAPAPAPTPAPTPAPAPDPTPAPSEGTAPSSESSTPAAGQPSPVGGSDTTSEVKTIKIGFCQDFYPTVFISEDGQPDGYDISVFKAIDELLPQYEFEFEGVSQESVLIGLDTGVYEVGLSGFFKNTERVEKYLYPEQNLGGNHLSLVTRKDTTGVKTFADLAARGLKLAPLAPSTGTYTIAKQYNEQHPDAQVDFEANEQVDSAAKYQWLVEGRYDAVFDITDFVGWTTDALKITDQVTINEPFSEIPTWPLFRKDQTELAKAYDGAIAKLRADGVIAELSKKYFD